MSDEVLKNRLVEINALKSTKKYLTNNRDKLIHYGIEKLLNSNKSYHNILLENKDNISMSLANDIDMIIEYFDTPYKDSLINKLNKNSKFYSIYYDFYDYLISFIENVENVENVVKENLIDSFNYLKNNFETKSKKSKPKKKKEEVITQEIADENIKSMESFNKSESPVYKDSVVLIHSGINNSFGTGFAIAQDNSGTFILTAYHVVKELKEIIIAGIKGELIVSDDIIDLAVIYIKDIYYSPLLLEEANCDNNNFKIMGFKPYHKDTYVCEPIDCSFDKNIHILTNNGNKKEELKINISKDDVIVAGYSGAPLICKDTNKVVGVVLKHKGTKEAYAISIKYLKKVWNEMPSTLFKDIGYNTSLLSSDKGNISIPNEINIKKKSEIKPVLGVETVAEILSSIIVNQPDDSGMMIGIFGKWGRGKTYLAEQTWKSLKEKKPKYKRIVFSAWKYQDTKSSWAYLYEKFIENYLLKNEESNFFDKVKNYFIQTKKIWDLNIEKHKWFPIISFGLMLTLSIVWTFFIDKFSLWKFLISTFGLVVTVKIFLVYLQQKTSAIGLYQRYFSKKSYSDYLGFQSEIESELTNLLETWIPQSNDNEKIILFVDDIDRCDIEQVISIIDGLRVILDNPVIHERLIIITAIDEKILKKALKYKYEFIKKDDSEIDSMYKEYLEKIFLIGLKLNALNSYEIEDFLINILPKKQEELDTNDFSIGDGTFIGDNTYINSESTENAYGNTEEDSSSIEESTKMEKDDYEITNEERKYLIEVIKQLENTTPRKIRIFYYKYLIMKQLFHIRLEEKSLVQDWQKESDEKIVADILVYLANGNNIDEFKNNKGVKVIEELKYVANMVSVL